VGVCNKSLTAEDAEMEELFQVLREISKREVAIRDDFNYPGINWDTCESDSHGTEFRDLVRDNFLFQHVHSPTRGENILELVQSSNESVVEHMEILDRRGNSYHGTICWELICNIRQVVNVKMQWKYHKGDYDRMRDDLMVVNWEEEFAEMDVEAMWQRFGEVIDMAISKWVPSGRVKQNRYPKWMSRAARMARTSRLNR
jgi:hypothetical protein